MAKTADRMLKRTVRSAKAKIKEVRQKVRSGSSEAKETDIPDLVDHPKGVETGPKRAQRRVKKLAKKAKKRAAKITKKAARALKKAAKKKAAKKKRDAKDTKRSARNAVKSLKKAAKKAEKVAKKANKTTKKGKRTWNVYASRTLKGINAKMSLGSRTKKIINSFVNDVFDRLATKAAQLARVNKKKTLGSREMQTAVRLVLPAELARHAMSEGTKAVAKLA